MTLRPWLSVVAAATVVLAACASSTGRSAAAPGTAAAVPEVDPRDPLAPTRLMREGHALVAEDRVEEGVARYRAALKLQPANPTIHNLIGQAELRRGDSVKALEAFNQAL